MNNQIEKSYDYMVAIFQKQSPRIPSFIECYGDGSIHAFEKSLAESVYKEIINYINTHE